ncbi:MAG TPA: PHP domain-containing protein [Pseudomonadales bacterium]
MALLVRVKSHHSLGFGTASAEALVSRAGALGIEALALTDLESLAAQPEFHARCRGAGIRPVSGVELRPNPGPRQPGERAGRLVLLARNAAGYRSLCRIVSLRRGGSGSRAEQRLATDAVQALGLNAEGLLALSDDPAVLERVLRTGALGREQLGFLLVSPHGGPLADPPERIRALGIVPVADADAALLCPDDHDLHRLLLAVGGGRRIGELDAAMVEAPERCLPSPRLWSAAYRRVPQALRASERIAETCELDLADVAPRLPQAGAFGGEEPAERLERRCRDALAQARRSGRCRDAAYSVRLDEELGVIRTGGFAGYFLAAAEVADAARESGVAFAPRGSAVGSLVVHLLGVSPVDPIDKGLLFERFLHAKRVDPPDIDIDIDSEHRDALVHWVRRRFGSERVAMVGAHHRFRLRTALREGLRAVGVAGAEIQRISAWLPGDEEAVPGLAELGAAPLSGVARAWLPTVLRLIGVPRLLALHPSGVLIADEALATRVPLERSSRGIPVSQYDLRAVERTRFLKLDLLGSKALHQIAEARVQSGSAVANAAAPTPDDHATLDCLDRADTVGCFQVETPAVRGLLAQIPIRRLEDCVAALALVRPGAAAGAAKRDYVARIHREHERRPPHPWLAERLAHTHGVLLYDEDLMALLGETAGLSLADADLLRTAIIDAGDDADALRSIERWYRARARATRTPDARARAVWLLACRFAAYSFAKAHAWSYALQAYAAVYWKVHHPGAFACGLLNGYGGAYPLRTVAADLARHGLRIHPPDVNVSAERTRPVAADGVRVGLGQIRHLTAKLVARLLETRARDGPFHSVDDLLARVGPGRRELSALLRVGACDALPPLSAQDYPYLHEALLAGIAGELSPHAFEELASSLRHRPADDPLERRFRLLTRIRNELDYLEMHLTAHPMAVLREEAAEHGCQTVDELTARAQDDRVRLAGLLAASRRHPLGDGAMQFLTVEDETGLLEATIPPGRYRSVSSRVTTPGPYLIDGLIHEEHGYRRIEVLRMIPFHQRRPRPAGM